MKQVADLQWQEARETLVMRGWPRDMAWKDREAKAEGLAQLFCQRPDDVRNSQCRGPAVCLRLRSGFVARRCQEALCA